MYLSKHEGLRVHDKATATWKKDKLNSLLLPEEVELINAIRLSRHNQCDKYIWPYNPNLEYTVKLGYWTATHDFVEEEIIAPDGSLVLKAQTWKLEILPMIQHFVWKTISGALPTYVQLCSRGINMYPTC